MEETRKRAENTDRCPYCEVGSFRKSAEGKVSCSVCGAYFVGSTLLQNPLSKKLISSVSGTQIFRIRKWQQKARVGNAVERNLAFAFSEIERLSTVNELPKITRESSATIYKKAVEKNLLRGRSIEGVAAGSIYAACRMCGTPRTIDEIARTSAINKKELGRTYRFLTRELKLGLLPAKPQDYIPRLMIPLKLADDVGITATELLDRARDNNLLSGLGPLGIAAGALYIAAILCNEHRSQYEVATAAGISEVTLRCRYKTLANGLGIKVTFE